MINAIIHPIRTFRERRKERSKWRLKIAMCDMMDAVTAAEIEAIRMSLGSAASKSLYIAEAILGGVKAKLKIWEEDPVLWADRAKAGVELLALRMAQNEVAEKIKSERGKSVEVGEVIGEGAGCMERLAAKVAESHISDGANK